MVDLFTIFGKVAIQRAWELDESGRHSQKSRPSRALQTMRSLTGVVVKTNPSCDYWSEDIPPLRLFYRHICEIIQSEITVVHFFFNPSCV